MSSAKRKSRERERRNISTQRRLLPIYIELKKDRPAYDGISMNIAQHKRRRKQECSFFQAKKSDVNEKKKNEPWSSSIPKNPGRLKLVQVDPR